ncbi:MAG: AAA family ATPase [Candidatus Kapabacteria bacterium]|nr:AAA family ATPase [Candidatus Kapabacteria bacterium]
MEYHQFEKEVYNWLLDKHSKDPDFTFSVRLKSAKGAEKDYFIGTERSRYFGTTFWIIKTAYPGSSSDLIDLIFTINKGRISYFLEFNQTNNPHDLQNALALELIKNLEEPISKVIQLQQRSSDKNKFLKYKSRGIKEFYDNLTDMFNDIEKEIKLILPFVDSEIIRIKKKNPTFIAERISKKDFDLMQNKLYKRLGLPVPEIITTKSDKHHLAAYNNNFPKNLILYGPPGTGKTYNTKRKAVQIIENLSDEQIKLKDDNFIKSFYDKYKSSGQIEFVTFHQSYYYEQFVEGISVITSIEDNKSVIYKVKSGILKEIYERIKNYEKLVEKDNFNNGSSFDFDKLYTAFMSKLSKILTDLDENENHYFESRRKKVKLVSIVDDKIATIGENANSNEVITKDHLKRIYNKFNSPEDIKNINKDIREVGTDLGWTTNYYAVFKALKDFESSIVVDNKTTQSDNKKNYVLIIDEINRGNISKIFGELITLIEDDKRLGEENEIIVTLPYSGEQFGVPPNLYIIGTMNTADRSLVQLDTALRRRFDFEEMMPKYNDELWITKDVEGFDLRDFLQKLNQKICKEYDREHQIGHSFLMKVSTIDELKRAWENKIMPLLQEYFYGDYDKLVKIIGEKSLYLTKKPNENETSWELNMRVGEDEDFNAHFQEVYNFVTK